MSGIVKGIFGGEDPGAAALQASLDAQARQQRIALSASSNQNAMADQQLARGRRSVGSRNLLAYLDGNTTLG